MSRMSVLVLFTALWALDACAASTPNPTPDEIVAADYGPPPTDARQLIVDYLKDVLRDPYTAVIEIERGPAKKWGKYPGGLYFAYGVCVSVNAKNAYGGYTGAKTYAFYIKRDAIHDMFTEDRAEDFCLDLESQMRKDNSQGGTPK